MQKRYPLWRRVGLALVLVSGLGLLTGCQPPTPAPLDLSSTESAVTFGDPDIGTLPNTDPVSLEQATEMFDDVADDADIAYDFPPDGCYARAHLMSSRIEEQYGVEAGKIWAFGDLSAQTEGAYGTVNWRYHVASVVPVAQPDGSVEYMVIDPSLADGPITTAEWKALMNDPNADLQITEAGTAPTNPQTGTAFEGTGYWPGPDPTTYGGLDGYSAEVMRIYGDCADTGTTACSAPPAW